MSLVSQRLWRPRAWPASRPPTTRVPGGVGAVPAGLAGAIWRTGSFLQSELLTKRGELLGERVHLRGMRGLGDELGCGDMKHVVLALLAHGLFVHGQSADEVGLHVCAAHRVWCFLAIGDSGHAGLAAKLVDMEQRLDLRAELLGKPVAHDG